MKAETLLVFFVAAIFLQSKNVYGFNGNRILNGSNTPPGVFEFLPLLAVLTPSNQSVAVAGCSSTIISKRHILTAAHCVYSETFQLLPNGNLLAAMKHTKAFLVDYRPKNTVIQVDGKQAGKKIPLFQLKDYGIQSKIYVHPSYSTVQLYVYDIAIIEFPDETELGITPITLISDFEEKDGGKAIAAGYGVYKEGMNPGGTSYSQFPDVLQNVTVPVHTPSKCTDSQGTTPTLICTGTADYRAAGGDSGGPLMIERNGKYYQIGVLSAGLFQNAVYTRLSMTCDWISKVTKGAAECKPLSSIEKNPVPPPPQPEPINPSAPPAPEPSQDETTTKISSNETDVTDAPAPQPPPLPEPQNLNSNGNVAFTFNVLLLFLFFSILVFA